MAPGARARHAGIDRSRDIRSGISEMVARRGGAGRADRLGDKLINVRTDTPNRLVDAWATVGAPTDVNRPRRCSRPGCRICVSRRAARTGNHL